MLYCYAYRFIVTSRQALPYTLILVDKHDLTWNVSWNPTLISNFDAQQLLFDLGVFFHFP